MKFKHTPGKGVWRLVLPGAAAAYLLPGKTSVIRIKFHRKEGGDKMPILREKKISALCKGDQGTQAQALFQTQGLKMFDIFNESL